VEGFCAAVVVSAARINIDPPVMIAALPPIASPANVRRVISLPRDPSFVVFIGVA
jgi:hypothetical protein